MNSRSGRQQIRVFIAAGPVFGLGIRRLLEAEDGFNVVGGTSDSAKVVKLVRQIKPDVLLLERAMSKHLSLIELRELCILNNLRVILLCARQAGEIITSECQLADQRIVFKDSAPQVLFQAIQTLMPRQGVLSILIKQRVEKIIAAREKEAAKRLNVSEDTILLYVTLPENCDA